MRNGHVYGLTDVQVRLSREKNGNNALIRKQRITFFKHFLSNFGDPIIKVLLTTLAINIVFLFRSHDWFESIGIALAVLLATLVSTLSEYGSEAAFELLQQEANAIQCRVYRNGILKSIPIDDIVVDDIIALQSGEQIPADGTLMEGTLTLDQSAINGESAEVEKISGDTVLRGSVIGNGQGIMRVTTVGNRTVYGQVATELQENTRESPLKLRLTKLANLLSRIGFAAAVLVGVVDLFHSLVIQNGYAPTAILATLQSPAQLLESCLHAITLAVTVIVVAVPEGLPMMITVVLSSNMRKMLKDRILVRKLVGIETSGSLTMLFTDKTGTLTEGKPSVNVFVDGEGTLYRDAATLQRQKELWKMVTLSSLYNTESQMSNGQILGGNATDKALLDYVCTHRAVHYRYTVTKQLPFSSDRKWSACEITSEAPLPFDTRALTLYKGAPEYLLAKCDRYLARDGKVYPFTDSFEELRQNLEKKSMRLLALVFSDSPLSESPTHLIFLGFVGLRDDIRNGVRHAVSTVSKAGIQTVMITGDGRETAVAIARSAGLLQTQKDEELGVLTGRALASMADDEVKRILPYLRVVARALPSDKSRLVRLAQECGYVVGMTGDGVNDAPALKKADVGFAMGSGTEVAKQAGDIVILDNNFVSICKAVLYGRTIFKSIRKFIVFQLTMNVCAVAVSIIGPFIGIDTPITVMQMLWINMIMDTLAGMAFAGETPLEEYMEEPPKRRDEPIVNRYMLHQIICTGGYTIALCTAFLKADLSKVVFRYDTRPIYWITAFFVLFIFSGIFNCFNARTTRLNLLSHLRHNRSFIIVMTAITAVQVGLVYYGGSLFRTAPLSLRDWLITVSLAATVIPFDMLRKSVLRLKKCHGSL